MPWGQSFKSHWLLYVPEGVTSRSVASCPQCVLCGERNGRYFCVKNELIGFRNRDQVRFLLGMN